MGPRKQKELPQAALFPKKKNTMLPKDTYEGRVVFITGGGTGLGKGMAQKFSQLGANVVIAARLLLLHK
jgi:2,4-dienoyl-CoA reductase